ncbi:MAG: hypothetical protein RIR53_1566 [Bacteroidota bacterium]|jgi:outer membrane protein OmpA-like peptidoglycan-associated protein
MYSNGKRWMLHAAFCVLACSFVLAQTGSRTSWGGYGALTLNQHSADFRSFPGVPNCCPLFQSGSGTGMAFGALGRLPLSSALRAELRLGYTTLGGTLTRLENTVVSGGIPGQFEHRVDASLSALTLEPMIGIRLAGPLHAYIGTRIGVVSTARFSQKETIIEPLRGTFPNGSRVQNVVTDAAIPNTLPVTVAAVAGVQADLPLNAASTLLLVPEISYAYNPTSVVDQLSWNVHQLRIGASIVWAPSTVPVAEPVQQVRQQEDDQRPRVDTAVVASSKPDDGTAGTEPKSAASLTLTMSVSGVESDGTELSDFVIRTEEFASVMMTPLLNYVFFDEGEASLPSRYSRITSDETSTFREELINSADRLPTYYQVLNIIGSRLRRSSVATITLVGCNADVGIEYGNTDLSMRRALQVRQYLNDVWGIAEGRMILQQRNLPEKAALSKVPGAAQENRRVEIIASDPSILTPIISRDTLRTISPPSVRMRPAVIADHAIARWQIRILQSDVTLKTFSGTGAVPNVLDWHVQQESSTQPRRDAPLDYQLEAEDTEGHRASVRGQLPVRLITVSKKRTESIADKEIDRFSLILFDIRSSELSQANKSVIDLIRPYIRQTSTVTLTGLTDRLGNASQNETLAESRARSVAKSLGVVNIGIIRANGNAATYAPDLPEGRLYTRTVDVIVETPVQP